MGENQINRIKYPSNPRAMNKIDLKLIFLQNPELDILSHFPLTKIDITLLFCNKSCDIHSVLYPKTNLERLQQPNNPPRFNDNVQQYCNIVLFLYRFDIVCSPKYLFHTYLVTRSFLERVATSEKIECTRNVYSFCLLLCPSKRLNLYIK